MEEKPSFNGCACCRAFWSNKYMHRAVAIVVFFVATLGWNYQAPMQCISRPTMWLLYTAAVIINLFLIGACIVCGRDTPALVFVASAHTVLSQLTGTLTSIVWCQASNGPNVLTALGGSVLVLGIYVVLGVVVGTILIVIYLFTLACRSAIAAGATAPRVYHENHGVTLDADERAGGGGGT
jgi:hypothetical protein